MPTQPAPNIPLGYDTRFEYGNTADFNTASSWTAVFANPILIDPPFIQWAEMIVKTYSTPGMVQQSEAGWGKPADVKANGYYAANEYGVLVGFAQGQKAWRVILNDAIEYGSSLYSVFSFNGWLKETPVKTPLDGFDTTEITIAVSGQISWQQLTNPT